MQSNPEFTHHYYKDLTPEQKAIEERIVQSACKLLFEKIEEQRKEKFYRILGRLIIGGVILFFVSFMVLCWWASAAHAETIPLKASWYSVESLKKEGTWKTSKGVMANGHQFSDTALTCATRLFPLGTTLKVCSTTTGKFVVVKVTDRIGKRFAKTRVDLSKLAFSRIAKLEDGVVAVKVEVITKGRQKCYVR